MNASSTMSGLVFSLTCMVMPSIVSYHRDALRGCGVCLKLGVSINLPSSKIRCKNNRLSKLGRYTETVWLLAQNSSLKDSVGISSIMYCPFCVCGHSAFY